MVTLAVDKARFHSHPQDSGLHKNASLKLVFIVFQAPLKSVGVSIKLQMQHTYNHVCTTVAGL